MTDNAVVKELLEAGAHFGHLTSVWHPKMKDYIFTQRNRIHIIDLEKTAERLEQAYAFVRELITNGQTLLFVGTKKQAQEIIEEEATRCGMCYVNQRWIGGILTNFDAIQSRINYLVGLEDRQIKGELENLPKKEKAKIEKEISRLNIKIGGFKEMDTLPGAMFVVDIIKDKIALSEAKKLDIPVVAIVDTNCNPDEVDYPIPANDDAIKAIRLICSRIADAVLEGKQIREQEQLEMVSIEGQEMEEGVELLASYSFSPDEEQPGEAPQQPLEEQAVEQPLEEQAVEQPKEQVEEPLEEQAVEQPLEEQAVEQPKEQVEEPLEEQAKEQPKEQVEELPEEQPGEAPKEPLEEQAKEQPKEQVEELPEEQAVEQPKEQVEELPEEEVREQPKEQVEESLQEETVEQPKEQVEGLPEEQAGEQPKEQ